MKQSQNFINILSNVKLKLRSFDEAGLIDDGDLVRHSDWIINRLGNYYFTKHEIIIDIKEGKAVLPFNLKNIIKVTRCTKCNKEKSTVRYYYGHPHTFQVRDHLKNICYNNCKIEQDYQEITRTIYIDQEEIKESFCNKKELTLDNTKGDCDKKDPNTYSYDDKFMYFNFDEGNLYVEYYGYPLDDDGYFLIDDDPYLEKAIEDYLIYQTLLTIYYNNEGDVGQRLQFAEKEHKLSLKEALYIVKLPTRNSLKKYSEKKKNSLSIFNLRSKADAVFNKC